MSHAVRVCSRASNRLLWSVAGVLCAVSVGARPAAAEVWVWYPFPLSGARQWHETIIVKEIKCNDGHDVEGFNNWGRSCCGCDQVPYPCGPEDQVTIGPIGWGHPQVVLSVAVAVQSLEVSDVYFTLDEGASLSVTEQATFAPKTGVYLGTGTSLSGRIVNQGTLTHLDLGDPVRTVTITGLVLENSGYLSIHSEDYHGPPIHWNGPGLIINRGTISSGVDWKVDADINNNTGGWFVYQKVELAGQYTQTGGELDLGSEAKINNVLPMVFAGGTLEGSGEITGEVVNSGGTVKPNCGLDCTMTVGGYTQGAEGRLQIRSSAQQLEVGGAANLNGTLLVDSATPGTEYVILTAGSVNGRFASVSVPGQYALTYEPTRVLLTILSDATDGNSSTTGDLDQDGVDNSIDDCSAAASSDQADSDGDGLGDACDGCPSDAAKSDPEACGCGAAETPGCISFPPFCGGGAVSLMFPALALACMLRPWMRRSSEPTVQQKRFP